MNNNLVTQITQQSTCESKGHIYEKASNNTCITINNI